MPKYFRSKTAKNRVPAVLDALGVSVDTCAENTGLSVAVVRDFCEDERLLPDFALLEDMWKAYPTMDPTALLAYEPASPGLTAKDMLARPGDGEAVQVTVCGAGNLGHVFAGLLSAREDLRVNVCVSTPEKAERLNRELAVRGGVVVKFRDREVVGRPRLVTADPALAVPGSRLILICVPSFVETSVLERIAPFLEGDAVVGSVPAPGGFDWKARDVLRHRKDVTIFGVGTIPWMCKIQQYGQEVKVLGGKHHNGLAVLPADRTGEILDLVSHLLGVPVFDVRNFLNATFAPGNLLLHPGIMYDLFHDWDGRPYSQAPLFYEEVSESAATLLDAMNRELLALRFALEGRLPGLRLPSGQHMMITIPFSYRDDVVDRGSLRSIIASNRAYAGIRTPMVEVEGGLAPDFGSRFFWEDIPHGLVVLKALAELAGVPTPHVDRVLAWSQEKMDREYLVDGALRGKDLGETGAPQCHGIERLEDLIFDRW